MGVDALRALHLDELGVILKWTIPSYSLSKKEQITWKQHMEYS